MKNLYKELSTVVLFAILVHSALTASLVNIFMTLHGVGGGGDVEQWVADSELYFSDALRKNQCDGGALAPSSSAASRQEDSWLISPCVDSSSSPSSCSSNFQQQSPLAKKKIVASSDDDNISLETYSAMLMKHRQTEGGALGSSDDVGESIESLRHRAKQSKFRYMR
eukprot:CAMPEP_0201686266 /NCGR_PEP_ID=MMETSP0578-20130828/779_1 /ASSEMBLY_ACC=CAM_ASM_000663 /TAXON_ID=267565 /ORGANISM="Skeletonema grethea, Strain CCMP 1804" /LENGTH=166 /DNA_ID=CAMNT_0048170303 /DNA_START=190 /DNA_END=693 /DNA_ORIENTATION=-